MSPSYSVVIPAHNAERTILAALASVVNQTLRPLEVLVVDDHSTDATEAIVQESKVRLEKVGIRLRYLRMPANAGPSVARNRGIVEAKGSHVAFLDADDVWSQFKLEVVNEFVATSKAGLVFHQYSEQKPGYTNKPASYQARGVTWLEVLLRNTAQTSCAIVFRSPTSYFDETMRYCEDYDLWVRLTEKENAVLIVGEPLTFLGRPQLSAGGLSGDTIRMRIGEMRVYYNFCRRKWKRRMVFLPGLLLFSLLQHGYSLLRGRFRLAVRG